MKTTRDMLIVALFSWMDTLNYGTWIGLRMIEIAAEMIYNGRL